MKILLTEATGYIGKRLLPVLLNLGHEVICCVCDKNRFPTEGIYNHPNTSLLEVDFLKDISFSDTLKDIDVAYYLIHSMSSNASNFDKLEEQSVNNFIKLLSITNVKQIIYLGAIANEERLLKHLASRKKADDTLHACGKTVTSIKAGIIVGSGSSSFEIIRDLVEKLPVMITPRWLNTKCQPVAIRNVIEYLTGVLLKKETYNQSFDIGGPDVLTYKEMLLQFAGVRGLKRYIGIVPVMTPRLSSYWLYFVTSTSYKLAVNLVNSMKVEVIAKDNRLEKMLGIEPISYREAVQLAFQKIEQNDAVSGWKDALVSSYGDNSLLEEIKAPVNGCFIDSRIKQVISNAEQVLENIWSIGGERGWYYGNKLWQFHGFIDKLFGGGGIAAVPDQ